MMRNLLLLFFLCTSTPVFATDLIIKDVNFDKNQGVVTFQVSWKNGWKNNRNHDAAWVFIKHFVPGKGYVHGKIAGNGHEIKSQKSNLKAEVVSVNDQVGVFIRPTVEFRGDVAYTVMLRLDKVNFNEIPQNATTTVLGLEMVYIPEGGFTLGDPDPEALKFNAFYKSDDTGKPNGLYKIHSEDQVISVGPKSEALYYDAGRNPIYTGDQKGPVPASFPKGVKPFYIMKYETTQGFYTDFLNILTPDLAKKLDPSGTDKYYAGRGSIKLKNSIYKADAPDRPCNFITWDDGMALADWAGLRPMTELEFTKAARGPQAPIHHEFPWSTNNKDGLDRFVDLDDDLKYRNNIAEDQLNDQTRHLFGASYYWVMDLAGSLWEKCVSIGHPIGRNFKGSHGDGILNANGAATNTDWPKGIYEEGGYGYRGGGYYQHGMRISEFNPHSPIAYRRYGAWAGGKRSIAYSQRFVRTVAE